MAYLEEDHQQYWETNLFLYNEELESLGWDKTQQQSSNSSQDSLLPSFNPPIKQRGQNRQQMAYLEEDHQQYWETNLFLHNEELESLGWEEPFSGYYDSSSPDGTSSSMVAKSILSERNRRQKLNKRLFALRSLIPNISKMDKASIIKDAIQYIQQLHEEEKVLQAEINQPELERLKNPISDIQLDTEILSTRKKQRILSPSPSSSIDVLELKVTYMGERTLLVSLTCERKTDTMVRLCEVFEALNLKIITANIAFLSGSLLKTVFVEGDENEKDHLKMKIETTIVALSGPESPMSFMSF